MSSLLKPEDSLADRVVSAARSIVGQKEKPGNSGFDDPALEQRMKDAGWIKGQAWCAYTGELIWKEGFGKDHPLYGELDKLFNGSAIKTFDNFKASGHFKTGSVPKKGALAIWRHGKGWQGHLAVVEDPLDGNKFKTIEGNTNAAGGREGIEVAQKVRQTKLPFQAKGLNLVGFVYLPE